MQCKNSLITMLKKSVILLKFTEILMIFRDVVAERVMLEYCIEKFDEIP